MFIYELELIKSLQYLYLTIQLEDNLSYIISFFCLFTKQLSLFPLIFILCYDYIFILSLPYHYVFTLIYNYKYIYFFSFCFQNSLIFIYLYKCWIFLYLISLYCSLYHHYYFYHAVLQIVIFLLTFFFIVLFVYYVFKVCSLCSKQTYRLNITSNMILPPPIVQKNQHIVKKHLLYKDCQHFTSSCSCYILLAL